MQTITLKTFCLHSSATIANDHKPGEFQQHISFLQCWRLEEVSFCLPPLKAWRDRLLPGCQDFVSILKLLALPHFACSICHHTFFFLLHPKCLSLLKSQRCCRWWLYPLCHQAGLKLVPIGNKFPSRQHVKKKDSKGNFRARLISTSAHCISTLRELSDFIQMISLIL